MSESKLLGVISSRDDAYANQDLAATLAWDDWAEDLGMDADERLTCHGCRSWADHAHDLFNDKRIPLDVWYGRA